ncbi:ATP-dependent RNA helicase HrpA [Georgenia sp. Z1491]|uniref:ATP-dependent RNA helicase HrpA n=1 Tax=Georgenia sp. Z1491 TaxID=3416707 RepID=UPI003CF5DA97
MPVTSADHDPRRPDQGEPRRRANRRPTGGHGNGAGIPNDGTGTDTTASRRGGRRRGRGAARGADRVARGPRPPTPEQVEARRAAVPVISYPEELPVAERRFEIAAAIASHQVVVVAGETGSGKTTQLPKICLDLGRGVEGMIGHTQPRRLAARSVAERIASELDVDLGKQVGYQVRFTDEVSATTLVKLMTDGILLAEIQRDPLLRRYDTIIVDEAHERSLNIDFLLGYLAQLLPRRPDLKLVITSATIDSERFAEHFGKAAGMDGPAPVVQVTGRTYPVDVRYRPLVPDVDDETDEDESPDDDGRTRTAASARRADGPGSGPAGGSPADPEEPIDQVTGILRAYDELAAEGPGDILVFLSGEREIRDTHVAFAEHLGERYLAPGGRSTVPGAVEILPLYARLTAAEQHRVFAPHSTRRVVLATNVAETSLTVPGIHYVIDPGTARISRYSTRTKVQRLPIEPVSRASAAQRSGRSGRVADGVAIRLYSRRDFDNRPEFTEPEILRTSLASVILQMASLGLGDVAQFPFVDPPDTRAVRDGVQQLEEIGALEPGSTELTRVGRDLARLPVDPRLGRMLLEAERLGCAAEVMVVVAALSVQDVRERPVEKQTQADQKHRRFVDETSDFLAYLNLWRYLRTLQRDLSGSAFRRTVRGEYLNYLRIREWQDVVTQLRQLAKPLGLHLRPLALPPAAEVDTPDTDLVASTVVALGRGSDAASADSVHQALLTGLLSNLGSYDERKRDYAGARGTRFVIWPGSGLSRKTYPWVMAAELVETSRLFARTVARVNPDWVERAAGHLLRRTYSEPYWSTRNGAAMVKERVLLYGMTLAADRPVLLGRLGDQPIGDATAAELAREMFVRHALVEGQWRTHHRFVKDNAAVLEEAREVEARLRRHGVVGDEDTLFAFYDERVGAEAVSARHFDTWWKKARRETPDLLTLTLEELVPENPVSEADQPSTWQQGDLTLPLSYDFTPGAWADGITATVPVEVLGRLRPEGFDWLVPSYVDELAVATIRALPKRVRRELVPAPDVARAVVAAMPDWHDAVAAAPGDAGRQGGRVDPADVPAWQDAFAAAVREVRGVEIDEAAWGESAELPGHLRMKFRVVSAKGAVLGEGDSLLALQRELAPAVESAVASAVRGAVAVAMAEARSAAGEGAGGARGSGAAKSGAGARGGRSSGGRGAGGSEAAVEASDPAAGGTAPGAATAVEQEGLTTWPDVPGGAIPASVETIGPAGLVVRGYPALVEEATSVALRVLPDAGSQVRAHRLGVRRLALAATALPEQRVSTRWGGQDALALASSPYPSTGALVSDLQLAAVTEIVDDWCAEHVSGGAGMLRDKERFEELVAHVRTRLEDRVFELAGTVVNVMNAWRELQATVKASSSIHLLGAVTDVRAAVGDLVFDGFVAVTGPDHLVHLPRYLKAAQRRLERAAQNVHADDAAAWQVQEMVDALEAARARAGDDPDAQARLREVRWLIEELRVSLFAQQLGTPVKVSTTRVRKAIAAALGG